MSDFSGKKLGKYKIVEEIARGGMGVVYKAYNRGLNNFRAIKIIRASLIDHDEDAVRRFKREAAALDVLRHPNIVRLHDSDIEGDIYYIVMEFIEGAITLQTRLQERKKNNRPFTLNEAIPIVEQLASALDYAHTKGIVHHDLKPENIMFINEEHVVLADFGIARLIDEVSITRTGHILGTPPYIAPEQCNAIRGDRRSDIYSLGVIFYEMVTGQVPYPGKYPMDIVDAHNRHEKPPPMTNINPDIRKGVEKITFKALATEPASRYEKASDFVQELKVFTEKTVSSDPPSQLTTIIKKIINPTSSIKAVLADPAMSAEEKFFSIVGIIASLVSIVVTLIGVIITIVVALLQTPASTPTPVIVISPIDTPTLRPTPLPPTHTALPPDSSTPVVVSPSPTHTPPPTATPFPPTPTNAPIATPTPTSTATTTPTPDIEATIQAALDATLTAQPTATRTAIATPTPARYPMANIIKTSTVRSGPDKSFAVVGVVRVGDEFGIVELSSNAEWVQIELSNESLGWVRIANVTIPESFADLEKSTLATPAIYPTMIVRSDKEDLPKRSAVDTLNPGQERVYTFDMVGFDRNRAITLLVRPITKNVAFAIYTEKQFNLFKNEDINSIIVDEISLINTNISKEWFSWSGSLTIGSTYYLRIVNNSQNSIDYCLAPASIVSWDECP